MWGPFIVSLSAIKIGRGLWDCGTAVDVSVTSPSSPSSTTGSHDQRVPFDSLAFLHLVAREMMEYLRQS